MQENLYLKKNYDFSTFIGENFKSMSHLFIKSQENFVQLNQKILFNNQSDNIRVEGAQKRIQSSTSHFKNNSLNKRLIQSSYKIFLPVNNYKTPKNPPQSTNSLLVSGVTKLNLHQKNNQIPQKNANQTIHGKSFQVQNQQKQTKVEQNQAFLQIQHEGAKNNKINQSQIFLKKQTYKVNHEQKKLSASSYIQTKQPQISIKDQMKQYIKQSIQSDILYFEEEEKDTSFTQNEEKLTNDVYLLKSVFSNRPATVFFPYPKACHLNRDATRAYKLTEKEAQRIDLTYKIPGDSPVRCVINAFSKAGFSRTRGDNWYCYWGFLGNETQKNMIKHQKYNHFTGCSQLGRKVDYQCQDKLWNNLQHIKRKFPQDFNWIPITYIFSQDFERIKQIMSEAKKNDIFIMKPINQACGRGIKLLNKSVKLKKQSNYLIQQYKSDPHLINELKYDLRIYVCVTSYDPLKIYIYKEGLCRFATEKYDCKKINQKYSHLTNFSINKNNKNFVFNKNSLQDNQGSKWSLSALQQYYRENNIDEKNIFDQINDIVIKTLISVEPYMISGSHRNKNFEMYGFDVLIDSQFKAWLLEVNVFPSLAASSPLDRKIKYSLLSDICNLVGFLPFDQEILLKKENKKKIYGEEKQKIPIQCSNIWSTIQELNYDNCLEKLSSKAWKTLFEFEEEYYRKGQFQRIFPLIENVEYYSQFFMFPRFNNILVQKQLKSPKSFLNQVSEQVCNILT